MTMDLGFSGQESDVNRACSAFGLDTVNYRAFPNNGPVLTAEPAPSEAANAPAAPPPAASAATVSIPAEVAFEQHNWQPPLMASDPAQQRTAAAVPAAPPLAAPAAAAQQAWPQAAAPAAFPAGPGAFALPQMPPGSAWRPEQNQQPAGAPPSGFALLRQALPAAFTAPAAPMPAFAMARAPLQPLAPPGVRPEVRPAEARPAANPESFGIAFGAAFSAAFGNAGGGAVGAVQASGFQPSQS
jgi:hypothetical protein